MNRTQLRYAAKIIEECAATKLRSYAVRREDGGCDWPDDDWERGSNRKTDYQELLAIAKDLRKLALSVPSAGEKALRRRTA